MRTFLHFVDEIVLLVLQVRVRFGIIVHLCLGLFVVIGAVSIKVFFVCVIAIGIHCFVGLEDQLNLFINRCLECVRKDAGFGRRFRNDRV